MKRKEAIGITVAMFNAVSSKHLTKEIKCDTLFQRIDNLLERGDGFIILPGGTGTLLEISIVWELINKNIIDKNQSRLLEIFGIQLLMLWMKDY
ncbi:MAG: LOG family protein [Ignavibacteriales bacterium]|nr:LOG family protein [Ignavibacteriales bacterium]